ncbi:MAG TPA: nucleotidyltransferase family protein, partial [Candidatus Polarisedimenticolia bacterium]|nr:nucleotidyltransferase family protein [Candidatus Polarisedimenticolia bacterium]
LTRLARAGRLAEVPAGARAILERELNKVRVEQTLLFSRFETMVSCLQGAGVDFFVHKGGALASLVYDRVEDRPMVDIDIVFMPADWQRVRGALAAAGFRLPAGALESFWLENYFNLSVTSAGDPPSHFDLHWSLTQEGRYHVPTRELFDRAVDLRLGELRLRRLCGEDLLLSLFLHLAYHYFEARLLWLYDMKLVIENLRPDWEVLLRRSSDWGLSTVTGFNLEYVEKVFPGAVPAEVLRSVRAGVLRRGLAAPLRSAAPSELFRWTESRLNQFVLGLLAIDRPADALAFALDKVRRSARWAGRRPRRR